LWFVTEDTELDSHLSIKASSLFKRLHCMYQICLWRTKYKKFVWVQKGGREYIAVILTGSSIYSYSVVGSGVSQERFNKLWMELNAEIEVQRHKAVIKTKKSTTNPFKTMRIPLPNKTTSVCQNLRIGHFPTCKAYSGILDWCVRKVVVTKEKGSSLGMSITVSTLTIVLTYTI